MSESSKAKESVKGSLTACDPKDKSSRVQFIIGLMAQNLWVTGATGPKLAADWKLHPDTVKKDAAEASRFFKVDPAERDAMKARWHAKIESAQEQAVKQRRLEALASLLKLEGDHLGVFEPQKVDVTVSGDDEQLARRLAALIAGRETAEDPTEPHPGGETTH